MYGDRKGHHPACFETPCIRPKASVRHRRSNFVHAHRLHLLKVFPSSSTPPFAGVGLLLFGGVLSVLRETRYTQTRAPP